MYPSRVAAYLSRANSALIRAEATSDTSLRGVYLDIARQWQELARQAQVQSECGRAAPAVHRAAAGGR